MYALGATSIRRTRLSEKVHAKAEEMEREKSNKSQKSVVAVYVNQIPDDVINSVEREHILLNEIIQYVSNRYGVSVLDLKSPRRTRPLVDIRQLAMYLARNLTAHSLPRIGRSFGRRDHTTVLNAVRRVQKRMDADAAFLEEVESVLEHFAALPAPHCYFGA